MAYSSAEKEFYQRHYQGELRAANAGDFGGAERNHFAPGKRYHLLLSDTGSATSLRHRGRDRLLRWLLHRLPWQSLQF